MNLRGWDTVQLALALAVVLVGTMVETLSQSRTSVSNERRSKQEAVESPADDYEDDYDDDEDVPSQQKTNVSDNALHSTQLLTKDYIEKARESAKVTLRCDVRNPTKSTIIMWFYSTKVLFQQQNRLITDPRYTLNPDHSLEIDNVQVADEGVYTCQVLPTKSTVKIELKLLTRDDADSAGGYLTPLTLYQQLIIHAICFMIMMRTSFG